MNYGEKIIGTLKNPKNAMNTIAEQPMIEEAVMIVGVYAILAAFTGFLMAEKITYVYEGVDMPSSMKSITTIASTIGALIGALLIWVVGTGIIHFISIALGGEGKFYPQMMTIIGFSMIPMLFGSIIGIIFLSLVEPMTISINMQNPQVSQELFKDPYLTASSMIGTLMQIWAAVIIFFGVKSAQRLTAQKSAIVAAIPLVIIVLSLVWSRGIL